jgi:hypothetical protein
MGYSQLHEGYRCLHIPSQRVYIFINVQFLETHFPFQHISNNSESQPVQLPSQHLTILPLSTPQHLPTISPQKTHPPSLSSHQMITRGKTNSLKPKRFPNHQVCHIAILVDIELTCYTQAIKHSN